MFTTIVTIGRNVLATPMSDAQWSDFKGYVLDAMLAQGNRIGDGQHQGYEDAWFLSDSNGRGFWDGLPEDSYSVTLLHASFMLPANYEELRNDLKRFAAMFNQEAIALIGEVRADLVTPAN